MFGGFSFGAPAGATNTSGTSAPSTTGFSFGAPTTAPPTVAGTTSTGGFSLGSGTGFTGFGGFGASAASAATTAASSFNFAMAAPKASTANTTAPAQSSGFGLAASTASAAPASGFSFGSAAPASGFAGLGTTPGANSNTSASITATATTAATGLGMGFGANVAPKSTATGTSLLGGLLSTPASQPPSTLSTASTTTAATGFSLGGTSTAATGFSLGGTSTASSTATGFSFGTALGQPSSTATTGLGGANILGGFTSTAATSAGAATTSTTTSALSAPGGHKQMTFRQLEDTINKWTTELEEQEKSFLDQATQVNAWDRMVMENGERIIQLNKDLERVKLDQQKLDHELDFVHSQQKELEELLNPLETALEQLPPISHTQHAHLEREHTYTLAESLDSQLKRMGQDMKEIVERLNSTNLKPDDTDPLQQITKILNAHVVSLMWVDRNSANLHRRTEEIAKMMDLEKREQERNFRMAYS